MKINEIAVDLMMKTSIFEMAFSKADAMRKVSDLQFEIAKHIIKVHMYHNSEYVNHWCNELNAWLHKTQDYILKGTNKPLPYDILFELLFEQPMESVEEVQRHMNKIYQKYNDIQIDEPDARIVHSNVERVMNDVCMAISKDKFSDIRNYLNV